MKAAIIGTGLIAKQHLGCLRELREKHGMAELEVAAVCDLSRAMAESAAERFGVPAWFTDHRRMLDQVRPDVVHVTTPPTSHYALTSDALDAGAHVILEKPATENYAQLDALLERARSKDRLVVEDYNYLFNSQIQAISRLIESGEFGEVVHLEVFMSVDLLGKDSPFVDRNSPHPVLSMRGGAIADFITHLASLAHHFVGPHRAVRTVWSKRSSDHPLPSDEFRALVDAERGTAMLGLSMHSRPDAFAVRVYWTRMRAFANLWETRLTIERLMGGPRPLMPMRNALAEAEAAARDALGGLRRKLSGGPGGYEGLWELLGRTYRALDSAGELPVTMRQVAEVNRLVEDLKREEHAL